MSDTLVLFSEIYFAHQPNHIVFFPATRPGMHETSVTYMIATEDDRCRSSGVPQGSNRGGYFYPRVRLPPGGVLLHYRCTSTPWSFYPARERLPPYTGGYFYPARAGLPPSTTTLPGYDYPPYTGVLIPCQGRITPRYSYPARVRLPPIHRGVLLPCQGRITPRYCYPARVRLPPYTGVLVPCQGRIIPRYSYPARVRLSPIHRGVLLPCQGRITPRYSYPARVRSPPIHRGVLLPCQGRNTPRFRLLCDYYVSITRLLRGQCTLHYASYYHLCSDV